MVRNYVIGVKSKTVFIMRNTNTKILLYMKRFILYYGKIIEKFCFETLYLIFT